MKAVKFSSSKLTNQNVHFVWQDNDIGTTLATFENFLPSSRGPQNPLAAQDSQVTPMLCNSH